MVVTRKQFLIYAAAAGATLAFGGKMIKERSDFEECVGKNTEMQQKMRGVNQLSDYVKSEVERNCKLAGKER